MKYHQVPKAYVPCVGADFQRLVISPTNGVVGESSNSVCGPDHALLVDSEILTFNPPTTCQTLRAL